MTREFTSFEINITEDQFSDNNILISEKTAQLEFFANETKISEIKLAYIDEHIAQDIFEREGDIILNNCFIDNFPNLIGDYSKITINNSILYNKEKIKIEIEVNQDTDFSSTFFISPEIDFKDSIFNSDVNFGECFFKADKFIINNSTFKNGLIFKNAKFSEGEKQFEKIEVSKGEINFNNVDFVGGSVSFQDSKLGIDRKTFIFCRFGNGFVDFTRTNFGGNLVSFEHSIFGDGNLSFRSSNFGTGTVDFRRAEFGDGEKNFIHTNFGDGNVKFVNSIFKSGKVTFRLADFGEGDVDFHFSHFEKTDLFFDRTKFHNGTLDFRGVDIERGRVNFNHLEFGDGEFIFESFELKKGNFWIKNSVFGKGFFNFENANCENIELSVENVDFGYGSVSFNNSSFKKIKLKNTQLNSYFDLRVKKAEELDLSNAVIKDILDLNPAREGLNVKNLYIQGVRLIGKIYIDWHRSKVKEKIINQNVSYSEKSDQFRILKENYRNMGLYEYEDLAYVEFKRMESKAKLEDIKKQNFFKQTIKRIIHAFEVLILDKMGQYATNPVRVLISMVIVYFSFSLLYLALQYLFPQNAQILSSLFPQDSPLVLSNVSKAFYHSVVTFLTIGYGDYYPSGIVRFLSGVEGFIGLFMMSYFTVAFVRKILR